MVLLGKQINTSGIIKNLTQLYIKKNVIADVQFFGSRSTFPFLNVYKWYFSGKIDSLTKSLYKQNQSYLVQVVFVVFQKVL